MNPRRLLLLAVVLVTGCAGDDDDRADRHIDSGNEPAAAPLYAVGSIVTDSSGAMTGYVLPLDSLSQKKGRVDLDDAYEFAGSADMWVDDGTVFVSGGESPTITNFTATSGGKLKEGRKLSFGSYGLTDTAFWNNTFVAKNKAYMIHDVEEYVIWDPLKMEITGTLPLPKLEARDGLKVRAASTDRGNVVHDGRLYQALYWSDDSYADRTDDSRIAVFDVEKDKLVDVLEAPCPGLDVGTVDDDGNVYFSNWTGGAGTHFALGTAPNCVVKVETKTLDVSVEFKFADIADGHEGAAFHYAGNGQFLFSVFHDERVDVASAKDAFEIVGTPSWRVWRYDSHTKKASELDDIDWNSGAVYWFGIDGHTDALIPAADYGSSTVYDVGTEGKEAKKLFGIDGYGIRLFRVR